MLIPLAITNCCRLLFTSPRPSPAASLRYNCAAYDGLCRRSLSHDSWSPLYCHDWTTATESLLDFLPVNLADCSPFSTRQRDWSMAFDHLTSLLQQLHWLSVPERVNFKLCVLGISLSSWSRP